MKESLRVGNKDHSEGREDVALLVANLARPTAFSFPALLRPSKMVSIFTVTFLDATEETSIIVFIVCDCATNGGIL